MFSKIRKDEKRKGRKMKERTDKGRKGGRPGGREGGKGRGGKAGLPALKRCYILVFVFLIVCAFV